MIADRCVQYGCGFTAPARWRNFDSSPTLQFERLPVIGRLYTRNQIRYPANVDYGDIVKGLPLPPGSCDLVYCSHVLEHLALEECRLALGNTWKILKPGGVFRLVLPDLEYLLDNYRADESAEASLRFMSGSGLGQRSRARTLGAFVVAWLGNAQHLWLWDFKGLSAELMSAGFGDVRRAFFGDSVYPEFAEVEDRSRWDGGLGIECTKPR